MQQVWRRWAARKGRPARRAITSLNRMLRGWATYFRYRVAKAVVQHRSVRGPRHYGRRR
ncbi:group II intron maturase-specific domain-containing protein [Nonomuraea angiospora]|uniref:group II intron maturase-specific domain-containing protein n=1 Tax=Nonomuraea angiospora TaxID=46172 RepID=UPI00332997DD